MPNHIGKTVGGDIYVHHSAIALAPSQLQEAFESAVKIQKVHPDFDYNVVRYSERRESFAFLLYEAFFEEPFPALQYSILVDLRTTRVSQRDYRSYSNPPVLHRKELLLPPDHPSAPAAYALTNMLEEAGLFEDSQLIGTLNAWQNRLKEAGFDWLLKDSGIREKKIETATANPINIARHRTAISRYVLSRPLQCLEKYGFLENNYSIFDYGCGKGDDLRGLQELGVEAAGWDPHFFPNAELISADIVNLGYVVNVIDDLEERSRTVEKAYALARKVLVVSAQLDNVRVQSHQRFKDGVLTTRGTFQKYFSHHELYEFIQKAVKTAPIAIAPGIYFVFIDKVEEQTFLESRQRSKSLKRPRIYIPRATETEKQQALYDKHKNTLDAVWASCLELGRIPNVDEVTTDLTELLEEFGSLKRVGGFLIGLNGEKDFTLAAEQRVDGLLVYLALNLFHGRPRYNEQPRRLQRDIKHFFRNHTTAIEQARALLFSVSDPGVILRECEAASQAGLGFLETEHSLTLHVSQVDLLSPVLRVYVGCASNLYGDLENGDLVKIHITSGKLSVMVYNSFRDSPLPRLTERIKIKMREQDIDFFDYGDEFPSPYLFDKSKYIPRDFPFFSEQTSFDERLAQLKFLGEARFRLNADEFDQALTFQNLQIDGFQLTLDGMPKDIDQPCGQYLTYRDLIACGETQAKTQIENIPREFDTFCALFDLATQVLDPVIDYFGMIRLTYGFCSSELSKEIPGGVAPELDQHASCELKRNGNPICPRRGAAADFIVDDEDMHEVVVWIAENTNFDRLYFYGQDRPIHVSFGPESTAQIVGFTIGKKNNLVPRNMSLAAFKHLALG